MNELQITSANFNDLVLNSNQPVILDFWAAWCAPCKMLAPVIGELASEYAGRIKVGKINIDEEPELARSFKIVSIPTVLLIEHGEIKAKSIGFTEKEELKSALGI